MPEAWKDRQSVWVPLIEPRFASVIKVGIDDGRAHKQGRKMHFGGKKEQSH